VSASSSLTPGPRGLMGHSLVYSLAPLVKTAVSLGMSRFYTFFLISALYGVKELVDLWMLLLQHLLGQGLLAGMLRCYYDHKNERDRAAVVTSTTLVLSAGAWLVCGSLLLCSDSLAPLLIGKPTELVSGAQITGAFRYLMLLIPFQLSTASGFYYLQTIRRSDLYTKLQTAKLFYEVALHIVLMGFFGMGLSGFLLGLLIGEITATFCLTGWMLVRLGARIDWRVFKPVVIYSAPLIPVGIFQLGLHQLDRRLIEVVFSGDEGLALVGIYGLGYKLAMLANSVCTGPFLQIWQPTIFAVEEAPERARLVSRMTTWLVVAISAVTLALVFGARQAVDLMAGREDFLLARRVVPWVAAGYVFWALYNSAQIPLLLARRTAPLVWVNALALAFSVAANLFLIPRLGILGAALATLATFALLAAMVMVLAHRIGRVRFELGRLAATFAILLTACASVHWFDEREVYADAVQLAISLGGKTLLLSLCLFALWRGVLNADERRRAIAELWLHLPFRDRSTP
jgi:O-antigen/teichoic acid export membrane protein